MNIQQLFEKVDLEYTQVVDWRRELHAHPEISFEEYKTSDFIAERLESFGYKVKRNVGGTGLIARLDGKQEGPHIAFRADFDALPIEDLKDVSYKSQNNGLSHACGHDGHTASLLGTAKILAEIKQHIKGAITFIFQHAEEKPPGGAKEMIAQNILKDVDYVFAAHLDSSQPVGQIAVGAGYQMAAVDYFRIDIQGKGGHGAKPHETKDALIIGAELVGSLQKIVSRAIDPLQSAVVTVGQFHAGSAFNVIANTAMIEGTVRTYKEEIRQLIREKIEKIATGITSAFDATYELDYLFGYPALYNSELETDRVEQILKNTIGEEAIVPQVPSMGAEDFAYFLLEKPGTYIKVGSANENPTTQFSHHHGSFDIDERALSYIQKAYLSIAYDYVFK
ncbi:M20 metallopeptidase family protein [Solibacillus cecembensis]|uniref:M20 metallopeptidase family protein n=1 Tax=Solibacillus cecembensis TaxID=459347 RepID=UPI003D0677C3